MARTADRPDATARAIQMRELSDGDRRRLIDAAPNCVGFDRFQQRTRQVALRMGYRGPNGGQR